MANHRTFIRVKPVGKIPEAEDKGLEPQPASRRLISSQVANQFAHPPGGASIIPKGGNVKGTQPLSHNRNFPTPSSVETFGSYFSSRRALSMLYQ